MIDVRGIVRPVLQAAAADCYSVWVLARTGLVRLERPDRPAKALFELWRWGATPAAGCAVAALRYPDEPAIIDDIGQLTFAQVHRRTNALARAFADAGVGPGDGVAVMCRNHRGFVETMFALSKLGADTLLLGTAFSGPQLTAIVRRERPQVLVYDEEFAEPLTEAGQGRVRFVAWQESGHPPDATLEESIDGGDGSDLAAPHRRGRAVILTSGTTGVPKGVPRSLPGISAAVSILSVIPLRVRERTLLSAPLFHMWGFAHFSLGLLLSSTLVLQRRFDTEQALAAIDRHRVTSAAMVPVMLQRLLDCPEQVRRRYDTSSLHAVAVSGSALSGNLAHRFMDAFGEVVYNLYGSTEVAWAAIATPHDLRAAPGTAGRPPVATCLRIVDERGRDVPPGDTGRIVVGNTMVMDGYTGGGEVSGSSGGGMATGDLGRFDEHGRLFVEGREDEMIVSGGENVFPEEVEETLATRDDIADVAVIGVDDEEWGQRLRAFVVAYGDLRTDDVKDHVRHNLARYKVPRDVEFVDDLPRSPQGKVLKHQLMADDRNERT